MPFKNSVVYLKLKLREQKGCQPFSVTSFHVIQCTMSMQTITVLMVVYLCALWWASADVMIVTHSDKACRL